VIAWHAGEPGIGRERGLPGGAGALILIADRDKHGDRDLAQRSLGHRTSEASTCTSARLAQAGGWVAMANLT
jgi:hypothetical protein